MSRRKNYLPSAVVLVLKTPHFPATARSFLLHHTPTDFARTLTPIELRFGRPTYFRSVKKLSNVSCRYCQQCRVRRFRTPRALARCDNGSTSGHFFHTGGIRYVVLLNASECIVSNNCPCEASAGAQAPPPSHPQPGQGMPHGYPAPPASAPPAISPAGLPGYPLPQPSNSGTFDLGHMKPSSSGSLNLSDLKPSSTGSLPVDFQDVLNRARGRAAEVGTSQRQDPRASGRQSYNPQSRSISPPRNAYDDINNPYRDERRDPRRSNGFQRDRSRSRSRSPPRGRGGFGSPEAQNYTRDRSPRRDDTETIPIDSNVVGLVIGRNGENLRRIEKETQTRIQFITGPDQTGPRRQCRIQGSGRNRQEAIHEINRIIEENRMQKELGRGGGGPLQTREQPKPSRQNQQQQEQPPLREGENSSQIMVPDKTVGLIIGRGGETIRDLQEKSGCHINILGESKSTNGLRPVNLIGNAQATQLAQELIMEIVESDTRNGSGGGGGAAQSSNQHQQPPQRQAAQSQYGQMDSSKESQTIFVPSEAVGMIIGKGKVMEAPSVLS